MSAGMESVRFDVWIAAIESGFMPLEAFISWADRRIETAPHQPAWVLNVSLAQGEADAVCALWDAWSRHSEQPSLGVLPLAQPAVLHVGFLYLMFREARLTMLDLLIRSGRYADGPGYYSDLEIACESFYYLANEIDGGGPTSPDGRPLAERVDALYAPIVAAARAALEHLPPPAEPR